MGWVHTLASYAHQEAYARWTGDPKKKYLKVGAPLTEAIIDAHLSNDQPIGIYINNTIPKQGDNYGRIVVLDFDDHEGIDPAEVKFVVRIFSTALTDREIKHVVVRSGGGVGFHIWIVLDKERRVDVLQKFGRDILAAVPIIDNDGAERFYEAGTGGVAKRQIEVFPKGKGYQNVALPLSRASKRVRVNDDRNQIEEWDDDSMPIYTPKGKGRPTQQAKADKDAAFDCLTKSFDPADYDHWVRFGHLLTAAFGNEDEWAKKRWIEWSQTAPDADSEDALEHKWDDDLSPMLPTLTTATFWFAARKEGYDGALPEGISFEEALDAFNEKFAVILEGNKVGVLYPQFDPELKRERFSILSKSAFTFLEKESKEAHMWLTSPRRRTYTGGFIYAPERNYPDCFNLWRGFSVKEIEGDWSLLDRHVLENISAEDQERHDYNMRWLAWSVQNPGLVAEVAFVMRGIKGTGKGVLANAWLSLWGRHGLAISNSRHLVGNFNAHMRDLSALFVDEGYWAGDKPGEGVLKSLLTESFRINEAKGIDSFPVNNCLKLMIASNEDWVVPATQGERRYHVNDVAPTHAKDSIYFRALINQLYNEGGLEAWLYHLRHYDLDGWHPRDNIPWTAGLADQISSNEKPEEAAMRMMLELGQLPGTHPSYHEPDEVAFPRMREAIRKRAFGGAVSDFRISKVLQNVGGERSPDGVEYKGTDLNSGKPLLARAMMYRLPPLDECRQRFDPQMKWKRTVKRWEYELALEGQNDIEPGSDVCM